MKQKFLIDRLELLANNGIYVFSTKMLESYLLEPSQISFKKTLKRAIQSEILEHPCRGVYILRKNFKTYAYKLEAIAATLRAGHYSYVSLESALSEYSIISQMTLNHLTVMTTGRSQTYKTNYGIIEFTHTFRDEFDILKNTVQQQGRPLRIALPEFAYTDLKRVKRNLEMVDINVLKDIVNEKNISIRTSR
ncbi:MAG: hypothetical protein V4629_12345 [Pseudomonadota bacterium]